MHPSMYLAQPWYSTTWRKNKKICCFFLNSQKSIFLKAFFKGKCLFHSSRIRAPASAHVTTSSQPSYRYSFLLGRYRKKVSTSCAQSWQEISIHHSHLNLAVANGALHQQPAKQTPIPTYDKHMLVNPPQLGSAWKVLLVMLIVHLLQQMRQLSESTVWHLRMVPFSPAPHFPNQDCQLTSVYLLSVL